MELKNYINQENNVLSNILNNISEALIIANSDNQIVYINKPCEDITGYSKNEVLGKNPKLFSSENTNEQTFQNVLNILQTNNFWIGELTNRHKNGLTYPIIIKIYKHFDEQKKEFFYYAIFSDISSSVENQNELFHLAYHDPLTNLPNRLKLKAQLEYVINNSKRNNLNFAVLFLDLDNFKEVNDTFGHAFGDELLISFANKLKNSIRTNDMVSRVGGDEFIIILSDISDYLFIERVCNKVISIVKEPIKSNEKDVEIGVSIGIAIYPENGEDIDEIIHNADNAMYHVKNQAKNSYEFFSEDMNRRLIEHSKIEKDLEKAIREDEFILHFHPEIDVNTNSVISLEILTRWNNSEKGLLYPGSFIPDLEVSELIFSFENLILKKACSQLKKWHNSGVYTGSISVNLSYRFLEYGDLVQSVFEILKSLNLDANFLEIEFHEKTIMNISEKTIEKLEKLSKEGVVISIDNFGKGFTSYSYLRDCYISKIKIDKSYIDSLIDENNSDEDIVKSILDLGENMNISVIAEGIELPQQDEILKKNLCKKVQGYYYAKPMENVKFENWYKDLNRKF